MSHFSAQVRTPNDLAYLPLVQGFVQQIAGMAGMPATAAGRLNLALEEAFTNILRYGFEPGIEEEVTVRFECASGEARVTLSYRGLPFDSAQFPDHAPKLEAGSQEKGLGLAIMRAMCDEVQLRNLGHGHLETVLIKRFASPDLPSETAAAEVSAPIQLPLDYEIRRMRPAEAVQVSRLAFLAYGETYAHPGIYFPEQINQLNSQGKMRSWVAVTPAGEVTSHTALLLNSPTAVTAEMAIGITKPVYRGHGCLEKLAAAVLSAAPGIGLESLYVTSVTKHPYSQQAARKHGFRECALLVAETFPAQFIAIDESDHQRETCLLMLRVLNESKQHIICAPRAHAGMLGRICDWLGFTFSHYAGSAPPAEGRTLMHTVLDQDYQMARITVEEYGADFLDALRGQLRSLLCQETKAIRLSLPLDHPVTAILAPAAETLGFFFCGIGPTAAGGIHLLLQHLGGILYDYTKLKMATDEGRALLEYVRANDPVQANLKMGGDTDQALLVGTSGTLSGGGLLAVG